MSKKIEIKYLTEDVSQIDKKIEEAKNKRHEAYAEILGLPTIRKCKHCGGYDGIHYSSCVFINSIA